jgi:PAS domain-containing protein
MPVCPRCGKCLSSEQALTYHLNRKYKCGTWNCVQCGMNHNTKFQLQIHEMQCFENREKNELPTTEILLAVYNQMPLICFMFDDQQRVHSVSPQCTSLLGVPQASFLGRTRNECVQQLNTHNATVYGDRNSILFASVPKNAFKNNTAL